MSTPVRVAEFDRAEFLAERWQYRPGEHVTLLGRTNSGKTTLAYELLAGSAHRKLPAVVVVMKPRDATVDRWNKALQFRKVRGWPPIPSPLQLDPPGWTLWPKHQLRDPDATNARLYTEFRKAILDSYAKGNRILFGDEVAGLVNELGLRRELETVWMRGRSMGCGLWAASQRPAHVPLHAYSQAEHLFLAYEADKRSRDRFGEIGGVDSDMVKSLVGQLPKWHWLYIKRDGPDGRPAMCVVRA